MKRKSLSLKKLYILASEYLVDKTKSPIDFAKSNKEMREVLRPFLKYVSENWQKDL